MSAVVEDAHRVMDAIVGYLADIGEDLDFLPLMLRAPHESMTFLGNDAALMSGIHVMDAKTQRIIDPATSTSGLPRGSSSSLETCHARHSLSPRNRTPRRSSPD